MQTVPECLVITVRARSELDGALDEAVETLKPAAVTGCVGISVTRLSPGRYEARLNSEVPAGTIIESWETARTNDVSIVPISSVFNMV